jgi:hypothetical protein
VAPCRVAEGDDSCVNVALRNSEKAELGNNLSLPRWEHEGEGYNVQCSRDCCLHRQQHCFHTAAWVLIKSIQWNPNTVDDELKLLYSARLFELILASVLLR